MQYRIRNGDRMVNTIGGGNLYTGTTNFSGSWFNKGNPWIGDTNWLDPNGNYVLQKRDHAWQGLGQTVQVSVGTYTFSCWAYFELEGDQIATFYASDWDSSKSCGVIWNYPQFTSNDIKKWIRVKIVFKVTRAGNLSIRPELNQDAGCIYLGSYCLQKGNADGQWSPNPADYGITDRTNAYRVSGLLPNTTYQFSVVSFNGLRESPKQTVTVKTRGLRVTVPIALAVGSLQTLTYLEYPLGIVPIGTEPSGFFGGGNRQILPAKVVSSDSGMSTIEITTSFNLMKDNLTMKQIDDGSFAVYDSYKALFLKRKE